MEELKTRILQEADVISDNVLKLDGILNHQVDPQLIMNIGKEFAFRFQNEKVTKVMTIESSGISVAFATALELGVPLLFARKKRTLTTDPDSFWERVPSFTHGMVTDIVVAKKFLGPGDRILFIDDIVANGDAARALIRIIGQSQATLVGVGFVVEKAFQNGARAIRETGLRVESLVRVLSLEGGRIVFG